MTVLYNLFFTLFVLLHLPKYLFSCLFKKKYRNSFSQRFGKNFPKIEKKGRKLIWLHAVSVGEVMACSKLAKLLKKEDNILLISTITETGFNQAKKSMPFADFHVFLPLDFSFIIDPIVKRCSPDLVILSETDFWYNFLKSCKNMGASINLVNGKMSENSFKLFYKLPWFTRRLFTNFDLFLLQNKTYQNRFLKLGVPIEKTEVIGNLKFDAENEFLNSQEIKNEKEKLGIDEHDLVIVAGSTHHGEEKLCLDSMQKIWQKHPNVALLLVPRHPERFEEVAKLLTNMNIDFSRYSAAKREANRVILVDAMGVLRNLYQLSDIAIVGGSFNKKVGGHNIIEPGFYGKPVLFGPYMHTQKDLVDLVNKYEAGRQVSEDELKKAICQMIENPSIRESLGKNGLSMTKNLHGITEKTLLALKY